jgi:hypothetical protein
MRGSTIYSALEEGVTSRVSHVLSKFLNPYIVFHRFQKQNRNLKEEGGDQGNNLEISFLIFKDRPFDKH